MRTKTVLCLATATLFLATGSIGNCFAGSGLAGALKDEGAAAAGATGNEPAGADVVAQPIVQVGVQTDALAEENGGSARLEEAQPASERPGHVGSSKVGIGLKISTLGVGIESALPLAGKLNLRGGANFFQYSRNITNDGIHYNGQLRFRSGEAHLDWFPIGGFHVSPGVLFYNGNQLTANAAVPAAMGFPSANAR